MVDLTEEERLVVLDALLIYTETDDPDPDIRRGVEVAEALRSRLKEEWETPT